MLLKIRWTLIRALMTKNERLDFLDIIPEQWEDYAELVRGTHETR